MFNVRILVYKCENLQNCGTEISTQNIFIKLWDETIHSKYVVKENNKFKLNHST